MYISFDLQPFVWTAWHSCVAWSDLRMEDFNEFSRLSCMHGKMLTNFSNIFCSLITPWPLWPQLTGFLDEVLDIALVGEGESHVAMATNSKEVKVFDRATGSCQLLSQHSGVVLCVWSQCSLSLYLSCRHYWSHDKPYSKPTSKQLMHGSHGNYWR